MDPTPEAPRWDNKCPHDDGDEIMGVLDEYKLAGPPKKKKKKKNKDSRDAVPARKGEDDATCPSTLTVEPEDVADEATPVPVHPPKFWQRRPKPQRRRRNRKRRMPNSRSSG